MHLQRATVEHVIATGGNYVLALKGTRDNVRRHMDNPQHAENVIVSKEFVEKGHAYI